MSRADRLGVLDSLINASKNKGSLVKIISPITEENSEIVEQIVRKLLISRLSMVVVLTQVYS